MAPKQAAQAAPIDITSNPVAKIVFDPEAAPEARSQKIAALLSPDLVEECKASIKQLEAYKEYLAQQRTLMQRRLIELSSTTVFSKMKQTFADMNKGVLDFREMIRPLVDNLDALYTLRTAGDNVVLDTFAEIEEDRKREADWDRRTAEADAEIRRIGSDKGVLENDIAKLKTQTGIFGGIKKSAQAEIAAKELLIAKQLDGLKACRDKVMAIVAEKAEHDAKEGKFKAEKTKSARCSTSPVPSTSSGSRASSRPRSATSTSPRSRSRNCATNSEESKDRPTSSSRSTRGGRGRRDPRQGHRPCDGGDEDKVQALSTAKDGEDTLARLSASAGTFRRHVTALWTRAEHQEDGRRPREGHGRRRTRPRRAWRSNVDLRDCSSTASPASPPASTPPSRRSTIGAQ